MNRPTDDGVPTRAFTNVVAAVCRLPMSFPTEPDRSRMRATRSPQRAGSVGLVRLVCQMPPDAVAVPPVLSMNPLTPVACELQVWPPRSCEQVWNWYDGCGQGLRRRRRVWGWRTCPSGFRSAGRRSACPGFAVRRGSIGVEDRPVAVAVDVGDAGVGRHERGRGRDRSSLSKSWSVTPCLGTTLLTPDRSPPTFTVITDWSARGRDHERVDRPVLVGRSTSGAGGRSWWWCSPSWSTQERCDVVVDSVVVLVGSVVVVGSCALTDCVADSTTATTTVAAPNERAKVRSGRTARVGLGFPR